MPRLSIDAYMMNLARMAAVRSTCQRRQVGAIMVSEDNRILSTGYNGSPPGHANCFLAEGGTCSSARGDGCLNTIHAEMNALIRCREKAATIYCTDAPCLGCLKALLAHNRDIKIIRWRPYTDPDRDWFLMKHLTTVNAPTRISDETEEEMLAIFPLLDSEVVK